METRAHNSPVDFYICCNGATIHYTDGTPLISTPLSCEVMRDFFRSEHVRSYTDGMLFFTPERAYTYRLRTDVPPSYLTPLNTIEEALRLKDVVQMGMRFRDREETLAAFAAIDSDFPNIFTGNMNRQFLDLNRAGVNKSMGIADFVRHMGWEAHDLFIIGDDPQRSRDDRKIWRLYRAPRPAVYARGGACGLRFSRCNAARSSIK